jgi:hypothetical protein
MMYIILFQVHSKPCTVRYETWSMDGRHYIQYADGITAYPVRLSSFCWISPQPLFLDIWSKGPSSGELVLLVYMIHVNIITFVIFL